MEDIKMTVDEIRKAMHLQLFSGCAVDSSLDVSFVTEEDSARMDEIRSRIDNCMAMDEKFKIQLQNDVDITLLVACSNAFDVGFNLGVSILKCLLSTEVPTIHVLHRPAERFERTIPMEEKTSVDDKLTACMTAALPYMSERQKIKLQGRLEYLVEDNKNDFDNLF
ncbi:MAG: hypothetical protein K2H01_04110 [Ruminococcus sp.]|nr:hypothetical protein [Ruminococcus sp.]